jgi:hypothetical protein
MAELTKVGVSPMVARYKRAIVKSMILERAKKAVIIFGKMAPSAAVIYSS